MTSNTEHDMVKAVKRAAGSVAFQWPGVIEVDDLAQELWVWLEERPSAMSLVTSEDYEGRHKLLVRHAHRIASEKRKKDQVFSGSFEYSVDDVKEALSGDALSADILLDLEPGMDALRERHERYAESITSRYGDGVVPVSRSSEQVALSRALTALTDEMNRSRRLRGENMGTEPDTTLGDGPGTRSQISRNTPRY